jgi:hypothetical protein
MGICGVGHDNRINAIPRPDPAPEIRHWLALKHDQENEIGRVDRRDRHNTINNVLVAFLACDTEEKHPDGNFQSACIQDIGYLAEPPSLYCQCRHAEIQGDRTFNAAVTCPDVKSVAWWPVPCETPTKTDRLFRVNNTFSD